MKKIRNKIWVKIIALLIIGVFSFNQSAYARHYTKDKSMEQFFESDLDQGLTYLAGTALSIAVPCVLPSFGASPALVAQSVIVGGGVNVGSQIAVAAGADPKTAQIVGGVVGGFASGGINLAQSGGGAWTVLIPTATWTASSAASAYAGEHNPILGMAAGMAAGMVTNVAMQSMAHSATGFHRTADGRALTKEQVKNIDFLRDEIKNIKPEDLSLGRPSDVELENWMLYDDPPSAKLKQLDALIMKNGDVWRDIAGNPIIGRGNFLKSTVAAFRSVSPGQWASLAVSAGVYEAFKGNGKDRNKMLLASSLSNFAGNLAGSLINQSDSFGKWYAGFPKDEENAAKNKLTHSVWYNPKYNLKEVLLRNAIYAGIDYGLGQIDIGGDMAPVAGVLTNGAVKYLAASAISAAIDKQFLTDTKNSTYTKYPNPPQIKKIEAPDFYGLAEHNLYQGVGSAAYSALPLSGSGRMPSIGPDAGYETVMYIQNMVRKFATGAGLATMYAYNFGSGLDNFASYKISSSAGDAIFDRDKIRYEKRYYSQDLLAENRKHLNDDLATGQVVKVRSEVLNPEDPEYKQNRRDIVTDRFGNIYAFSLKHLSGHFAEDGPEITDNFMETFKNITTAITKTKMTMGDIETADMDGDKKADFSNLMVNWGGINDPYSVYVSQPSWYLKSIYFDRQRVTLGYNAVKQEYFDKSYFSKDLDKGIGETDVSLIKGEIFKKGTFSNKVMTGLNDGSIIGATTAQTATSEYLGPMGLPTLRETVSIAKTPNVDYAREDVFFGYNSNAERDNYSKFIQIWGGEKGVRQDIPGITFDPAKLDRHIEDIVINQEGWTAVPLPADVVNSLALAVLQRGLARNWGEAVDYIVKFRDDSQYEQKVQPYKESYLALQNIGSFKSVEKGFFVSDYDNKKVAMLPESIKKAGFRDRSFSEVWATETDKFIYNGLSIQYREQGKIVNRLEFADFSKELPLNQRLATLNDTRKQYNLLLGGKDNYAALYGYNTVVYSEKENLKPFPFYDKGFQLRPVFVQPIEEVGRGITAFLPADAAEVGPRDGRGTAPDIGKLEIDSNRVENLGR